MKKNNEKIVTYKTITAVQLANALESYRAIEGWRWKSKLRSNWMYGGYDRAHREYEWVLQRFRNEGGIDFIDAVKSKDSSEVIQNLWNKEILLGHLEYADCIIVDGSPLLSSWEVTDNGELHYSFIPDENSEAEEYEIEISKAISVKLNEDNSWEVTDSMGQSTIQCYKLNALSVAGW